MPRTTDFTKLKKDDLLKKIGSKLSKDELVRLAQGLQNGSLTGAQIVGGAGASTGNATGKAAQARAAEQGLTGQAGDPNAR